MTYVLVITMYLIGADGFAHPHATAISPQPSYDRCMEKAREFRVAAEKRKEANYTIGCRPIRDGDPINGKGI